MSYQRFYEKLLEILTKKYPLRSRMTKHLANHLEIDQKSFARRLKGETPFTLQEIIKMCAFLDISLDTLMNNYDETVHPMKIHLQNLTLESLPESFRNLLSGMEYTAKDREGGRAFLSSNLIPNGLHAAYPHLSRFVYYGWSYRRYPGTLRGIEDFYFPAEIEEAVAAYGVNARNVRNSTYLFFSGFMENVSSYILFFHETDLLPTEHALLIYEELVSLLDEMEEAAIRGTWPGTGNRLDIYVTPLCIPNSILITESKYYKAAIVYAFFINPIINLNPDTFEEINTLAYSLLRQSENISGTGEKTRVAFFKKQREALSRLLQSLKL